MITKWYNFGLIIGILFTIYSCKSGMNIQQKAVKDIYGKPICYLLKNNDVIYFSDEGVKIKAILGGVEFNKGPDSLSKYLLKKYVNNPSYKYDEYNIHEYFYILFDNNLVIKEVRILGGKYTSGKRFDFENIFIETLKNTNGMWRKIIANKEWYLYIHSQKIY